MQIVELRDEEKRPGQRVESLSVEEGTVRLVGPFLEIRFPSGWARKLLPWADGPARNIVCHADTKLYNLVGITKAGKSLVLSYTSPEGDLRAETISRGLLPRLARLLQGESQA